MTDRKRGRPMIEFDLVEGEELSRSYCSFIELGKFFNCSEDVIEDRYRNNPDFKAAIDGQLTVNGSVVDRFNIRN